MELASSLGDGGTVFWVGFLGNLVVWTRLGPAFWKGGFRAVGRSHRVLGVDCAGSEQHEGENCFHRS